MQSSTQTTPIPKINRGKVVYPQKDINNQPTKYVKIVEKYNPEILKNLQSHPRWSECVFCTQSIGHPCEDSWMIPEDLYELVVNKL